MVEIIMKFISDHRVWILSAILAFAIPAFYVVVAQIFRDAIKDLKDLL